MQKHAIRQGAALVLAPVLVLILALAHLPALAQGPAFELPVDCPMNDLCSIQKYYDHDPGPGWRDYSCGPLSSDGHTGTDFRVPDLTAMRAGVPVVAAALGVVKYVRDGMDDVNVRDIGVEAVRGRDGGNLVVLSHDGGWETRYLHLRKGSVAVSPGQKVETGQMLGLIGMSGLAEYPHTHFTLLHLGRPVDPFTGPDGPESCQGNTPLWSQATLKKLPYSTSGLLGAGFATRKPEAAETRDGQHRAEALPADAPLLVFWADAWGLLAGDSLKLRLTAPDGSVLASHDFRVTKPKAQYFSFVGKKRPGRTWPKGVYQGEMVLVRTNELSGLQITPLKAVRKVHIR